MLSVQISDAQSGESQSLGWNVDLCLLTEGFPVTILLCSGLLSAECCVALFGFELGSVFPGRGAEREGEVALSGPAPQASAGKRKLRKGEPGVCIKTPR